ncbi:HAMP domain-containing sensor histidine kinase [Nocardioides sp.]|uniref:HAMP domain-containing sensor histidine kinase n=1 Tax=Nocardioides sp. TaxID=35761 RepID=UPI002B274D3F|nr:HAMP domain-containing sensor histidine kinase [Nocardioides sp.]
MSDVRGWHYRRSLASRVTLLATIAVGLSVAFLAVGVYVTARIQLQSQLDETLIDRARGTSQADIFNRSTPTETVLVGASDIRIAFLQDNQLLALGTGGSDLPVGRPELDVSTGIAASSVRTVMIEGQEYRMVSVPGKDNAPTVILAQSLTQQEKLLAKLGAVSLLFGLVGVLGAGIAGWGVARNGLRPVRKLTSAVEQIAVTEDLAPLPVEGDDEIARLATAFNQMLVALGASRDRQRRLVTDAGHELRTPLTSLRTNVDLLTQSDQSDIALPPAAREELLDDIRAQIDELTTLIGDLTELARDEPLAPVVGAVDLSEIVDLSVARVRRRAVGTTFDVETEPWSVVGEAGALERAVTNLLDNAAKWSPPGGTVRVRLSNGLLSVDDEGPGIAVADRARVFDRFWRAEESRTMPGSGLGLSIVRQVAERHSGTVEATASPSGGARLVLCLPGGVPIDA